MITCSEAVRQLWQYVEQDLDRRDRLRVEEHLDMCRRCCGEMEFAEHLRDFMAREPEVAMPAAVSERFERLIDDLETKGAP